MGESWRDSLLVQVGWSFLITSVVVVIAEAVRSQRASKPVVWAMAVVLSIGLTFTLLSNVRLAYVDRMEPLSSINNQISAATVNLDRTESGNARRCSMINAYTESSMIRRGG